MNVAYRLFWKILEEVVLIVFSIMLILVIAQVIFRYVLKVSVPWTEEAARWFYVWQIFLGSALAMKRGLHLRATFLLEKFPYAVQQLVSIITGLAWFIFLGGIFWGGLLMMKTVYPIFAGSFPVRMTYLYLALPVSLTIMIYLILKEILTSYHYIMRSSKKS